MKQDFGLEEIGLKWSSDYRETLNGGTKDLYKLA